MDKILKLIQFSTISVIIISILTSNTSAQQPKTRIISLTPASTEILFALGLKNEVIGVSSYCNWPAEAKTKEKIGSFSNPNIEKIISLKPDLVIITGMEQDYLKSILRSLKIDYIVADPADLKQLYESIEEMAAITGKESQAKELIGSINDVVRKLETKISQVPMAKRPKVYVEIWHDPLMSIGKSSFLSDMVEKAGGINITKDLHRSFSKLDPEIVIHRNPDIIILTYMKPRPWINERFAKRTGWADIAAVRNKKVFSDIKADTILRPGPRVKEGLIELYKRFYEN